MCLYSGKTSQTFTWIGGSNEKYQSSVFEAEYGYWSVTVLGEVSQIIY
jgi:hypothetical protein